MYSCLKIREPLNSFLSVPLQGRCHLEIKTPSTPKSLVLSDVFGGGMWPQVWHLGEGGWCGGMAAGLRGPPSWGGCSRASSSCPSRPRGVGQACHHKVTLPLCSTGLLPHSVSGLPQTKGPLSLSSCPLSPRELGLQTPDSSG